VCFLIKIYFFVESNNFCISAFKASISLVALRAVEELLVVLVVLFEAGLRVVVALEDAVDLERLTATTGSSSTSSDSSSISSGWGSGLTTSTGSGLASTTGSGWASTTPSGWASGS